MFAVRPAPYLYMFLTPKMADHGQTVASRDISAMGLYQLRNLVRYYRIAGYQFICNNFQKWFGDTDISFKEIVYPLKNFQQTLSSKEINIKNQFQQKYSHSSFVLKSLIMNWNTVNATILDDNTYRRCEKQSAWDLSPQPCDCKLRSLTSNHSANVERVGLKPIIF